jgi:hypothetical protein
MLIQPTEQKTKFLFFHQVISPHSGDLLMTADYADGHPLGA